MSTETMNAAVDALRDEMAAKHNDSGVGAVGEIMTAQLQARPEIAAKLLAKGKSLAGAYKALEDYARNNRGGKSCVFVPPEKAEEIILSYYGIGREKATGNREQGTEKAAPHPAAPADDFDLDALLGV